MNRKSKDKFTMCLEKLQNALDKTDVHNLLMHKNIQMNCKLKGELIHFKENLQNALDKTDLYMIKSIIVEYVGAYPSCCVNECTLDARGLSATCYAHCKSIDVITHTYMCSTNFLKKMKIILPPHLIL